MQFQPLIRKTAELGIVMAAVATLLLAGCFPYTECGCAVPYEITEATIVPYKGGFYSGATVRLKDAGGYPVSLWSGGTVDASGVAHIRYISTQEYPLIVEVSGDYYNEITAGPETASVPLRGLISSASAVGDVPVNIVTELAVADLVHRMGDSFGIGQPLQAASAVVALRLAGSVLGVPASAVPVFDAPDRSGDADTLRLSAWAVVANNFGAGDLAARAHALALALATLNPASAPGDVLGQADYNAALLAVTGGASSVLAAGASAPAPVTIPTASYGALYASAVAAGN